MTEFDVFSSNYTKINIREFLRSLIAIPRSKIKNYEGEFNMAPIFYWIQNFHSKSPKNGLHKKHIWGVFRLPTTLAGCATASTTAKTAEATDQKTSRYLLEIECSNDQSSDRSNFAVDRFCNSANCASMARMTFF